MDTPRPRIVAEGPPDIPGALKINATFDGLEVAGRGRYDVVLELDDRLGVWECIGLAVRHQDSRQRIDGDVLRRIRVADLVRAAAVEMEDSGLTQALAGAMLPPASRQVGAALPVVRSRIEFDDASGRYVDRSTTEQVGGTDATWLANRDRLVVQPAREEAEHFRRLLKEAARAGGETRLRAAAEVYKRATRAGRSPTKAVEQELGVTYNAAIGLVRRCRASGLLPQTTKGTASAVAPPRGRRSRDGR